MIVQIGYQDNQIASLVVDRDLFEDDIEQVQKSLNNFSTPLTAVDTQNRIWLKIITREKQNYDVKKRILRKQQIQGTNYDTSNNDLGKSQLSTLGQQ